jgi:hypothetical protein
MDDDDMVGRLALDRGQDGFEQALETLIALAEREGRDFLAYLLAMALVHVREGAEEGRGRASLGH